MRTFLFPVGAGALLFVAAACSHAPANGNQPARPASLNSSLGPTPGIGAPGAESADTRGLGGPSSATGGLRTPPAALGGGQLGSGAR